MSDYKCQCMGCQEERQSLQKQLDNPFYKRAEKFRGGIKAETMAKAAKKYKEPFNPKSWSNEQLAKHAMAENYDQENYIYGMYERMQDQASTIDYLKSVLTGIAMHNPQHISAETIKTSAANAIDYVEKQKVSFIDLKI